jgi:signal transduction histidine kinase/DNA-binding NarL/FixJ family response regulator
MSELAGLKLLRRIEEGIAGKTGEAFFRQIAVDIAQALDAHAAFSSRLIADRRAAMLAFWVDGEFQSCLEYSLAGTPCEFVYQGRIMAFARDIGDRFPVDREWFASLGVQSYLGIPVKAENGEVLGHLAVMDTRERDWRDADVDVLRLFSLRFAAELERSRYEAELESVNAALTHANARLIEEVEQRRAAESALAAAKQMADAANQAKSVFLTQMSHELRTPLNGLLGYAQLLERDVDLAEWQRANVLAMKGCGEHLLTLINDVLDLARIEAGGLTLDPTTFELAELLDGVAAMISVRAGQADIEFRKVVHDTLPVAVCADARRLRQVLLNLLGNAVKFTTSGYVEFAITLLEWRTASARMRFEIRDTGPGIPPGELARIFEPFHQAPIAGSDVEGTGLGLSISRAIVESMSGSISVSSDVGHGTTFTVDLEISVPPAVEIAAPASAQRICGYEGPRRRIMIVDDEAHNCDVLRQLLAPLDFELDECHDGVEMLERARSAPPDLFLVDLVMPAKDGIAALRELRDDPVLAGVPAIALSASAFADKVRECREAGADDFLAKPVNFTALLDLIGRYLAIRWIRDAGQPDETSESAAMTDALVIPPDIARRLLESARAGDVESLSSEIDALGCDAGLHGVALRLRELASSFDMKAVRSFVEQAADRSAG